MRSRIHAARDAALSAVRAAALLALTLLPGTGAAHEGHDHGEARTPPATAAPRGTSRSDGLELVAIARNGALTVFIDRAATNEPVTDAVVRAETPDGEMPATAAPDGSYRLPAHWSERPGTYEVLFTVTAGEASDIFPVSLTVPEPPPAPVAATPWHAGLAVAHDFRQHLREADPMPALIGGGGFVLGLAAALLLRRRLVPALVLVLVLAALLAGPAALAHEGHDRGAGSAPQVAPRITPQVTPQAAQMAAPGPQDLARRLADGSVFVPKPTQRVLTLRTVVTASAPLRRTTELPGRIIPDPNASGVVQSSVGGRLSPPASGLFPRLGTRVAKGDVLAYVTPPVQAVDVSDMRQRQGELDQQIAIVERRVERFRRLAPSGAVSQVQLEEAQAELKGLQDRRAALDGVRAQPEALAAPVSGVVAEANAVAGKMASPGAVVFQIVDAGRLWVEALSFDAPAGPGEASARLADGRVLALDYMGAGLADRSQAVPVQFAVRGAPPELRIGQFVTVLAATDTEQAGIALPRTSVVRGGNGQSLVYEHTAPERFEPREVRIEPLDAARVRVVSGLGAGKRVVAQGAELLDQVR